MLRNGYPVSAQPILQPLDTIENRDALLKVGAGETAIEAERPECDAIVGNPPFLGDKKMRGELGDDYVTALRKCYEGRVPGGADLVTYWFEKARARIAAGKCSAAWLVATNSIRGGANRKVLDRIIKIHPFNQEQDHGDGLLRYPRVYSGAQGGGLHREAGGGDVASPETSDLRTSGGAVGDQIGHSRPAHGTGKAGCQDRQAVLDDGNIDRHCAGELRQAVLLTPLRIFEAWSDEPWVNDGAAVRVSLVAFGRSDGAQLDGADVERIHSDLTAGTKQSVDLTKAVDGGQFP
ncbi:MAG: hypothetical protein Q8L93_13245 [Rhodocyclaceae bacterium]|nr:hypothetical protein [Rhodocyclaceae bacterium]MDP1957715.1 hypothetical protein [Rhodocyclaceae bacterium]